MNTTTENKIVVGVWPTLVYRDGQAALKFLTEGLGFTQVCLYPGETEGSIAHSELAWPAGGGVMVGSVGRQSEPDDFSWLADHPQSVYLVVDGDPDACWRERSPPVRSSSAGCRTRTTGRAASP